MDWSINPEIENVVVVDDVISSGTTVTLVRERNSWKFPRATWYAAVPVTRKEKIPNFKKIFSCEVVRDIAGKKVPINSLSTLIENPEIRQDYFARNFEKGFEEKFIEATG
jgi:hypoxanthine phosphoribosyltransferase